MDCNEITEKLRVRTTELRGTDGMMIHARHLSCRQAGLTGEVRGYVPGHGGDVWFVQHEGSEDVGAYCYDELERA
jgi:hypothetical protein